MGLLKLQTLFENEGFDVFLGALLKQEANVCPERFFFTEGYTGEMEIIFCLDDPFSYNLFVSHIAPCPLQRPFQEKDLPSRGVFQIPRGGRQESPRVNSDRSGG